MKSRGAERSRREEESYWRNRLFVRRYRFPPSGQSDDDLSVRIDHDGMGHWFPLRTADPGVATGMAKEILAVVREEGWKAAGRRFSRELIVGFEWCANPILWTYTTVHTLVSKTAPDDDGGTASEPDRRCVLVVESDPGISCALQWCLGQHPGFKGVACDSIAAFRRALAAHEPGLVLLNRNHAERAGLAIAGRIGVVGRGVPAVSYSVAADGDQLFVSTPGGADGYLLKRVAPLAILEPVSGFGGRAACLVETMDRAVRRYFKESLLPRPREASDRIARLTSRELDVLGLLSRGCVDKEIAQALGISAWTVHGHIKRIFERLGVRTRTEAVVLYLEK